MARPSRFPAVCVCSAGSAFRGQHEDIAVEEGELALLVAMPHVDRGMGGAVGFQDVVGVFLLAVDEAAQLPFMSGLGADKIPMVVDVVALVCHKVLAGEKAFSMLPSWQSHEG